MKLPRLCVVGLSLGLICGAVQAQPFGDVVVPGDPTTPIVNPEPVIMAGQYLTGAPTEDSPAHRVDPNTILSPFAGIGSLGLNGSFWATAVPISSWHVLTAGHAVDTDNNGVIDVAPSSLTMHLNYGGDSTHILTFSSIALNPEFSGFNAPALNDDVAVLTLTAPLPAGVPFYPILKRPMRQGDVLTFVGYGRTGWGNYGFNLPFPNFDVKRVGQNVADLAFLDDEGFNFPEVYVFDFDGPTAASNSLGSTTLGDSIETTLGNGDSGGPAFVLEGGEYQLAGINTFIARFTSSVAEPPMFGSAGGGIMVFPLGSWISSQTGLTWDVNVLQLNVQGDPLYVKPGTLVVVHMDALNLAQRVNGVQAFLNFSSSHFSTASGDVSVAAGGGVWDQLIYSMYNVAGDLDVAVGVRLDSVGGTQADGTTAVFTLKATGEGTAQMVFRPDVTPDPGLIGTTMLSDDLSQTILPTKVDSQTIIIDGTNPVGVISASQAALPLVPSGTAIQGVVDIVVTASDALSGLASIPQVTVTPQGGSPLSATYAIESPAGVFHYTWTVGASTPNGQAVITMSGLADRAGNIASPATATFWINKNQLAGTVQFDTQLSTGYTFHRDVVLVATNTQGAVLKRWTVDLLFTNSASTASAAYGPLTGVPLEGVAFLSAKTRWHLRQRQPAALDVDGQATVNFILPGGDINGSNSVNVLDYSLLKSAWGSGAVADINGDGIAGTVDYALMKSHWFEVGAPE